MPENGDPARVRGKSMHEPPIDADKTGTVPDESDDDYALLLYSPIPIFLEGTAYQTLDLWQVDLAAQAAVCSEVRLLCPIASRRPPHWASTRPVPAALEIVEVGSPLANDLDQLLRGIDVVQVPGNSSWRVSRLARQLVHAARLRGIKTIVGISSNRARAGFLNSARASVNPVRLAGALLRYLSIRASQSHLTAKADGTFIVGHGLFGLVSRRCPSLHVGIASWISSSMLVHEPDFSASRLKKLCIAARLEPMKGVHLGVEAMGAIAARASASLTIYGEGDQLDNLRRLASGLGVADSVRFGGALAYPHPFLDRLAEHGVVLLTNLSDEQPRLIFDAISQGVLPICPDGPAFQALQIPQALLYERGSSKSLGDAIERLWASDVPELSKMHEQLLALSQDTTIETMHSERARWITHDVLARKRPG